MKLRMIKNKFHSDSNLSRFDLISKTIAEGYISGTHKSPFNGYSAEFREHKSYVNGDSVRHVDWKLYAKTNKLFTKCFEEETNVLCHIILDISSSMFYPEYNLRPDLNFNKIQFSALASGVLLNILERQRDSTGLSLFSDKYNFYAPERGSKSHYQLLKNNLESLLEDKPTTSKTLIHEILHQIAVKFKRRTMIFLFTDLFQYNVQNKELFDALRHLKHNKHDLTLFHVYDKKTEYNLNFGKDPKRLVDVETKEFVDIFTKSYQFKYNKMINDYFNTFRLKCARYKINYVNVDIHQNFDNIMKTFFEKRMKFF